MVERDRSKVALAAMGIAALSLELLAVFGAAPIATEAMRSERTRAVFKAGGLAARAVSSIVGEQTARYAGHALMQALEGTTRVYLGMLSVTPHPWAREIRFIEHRSPIRARAVRPPISSAAACACWRTARP